MPDTTTETTITPETTNTPEAEVTLVHTPADTPIHVPIAAAHETAETVATSIAGITGNWNEQKTKLKAKFPNLTEADLHYENGKQDEMFTRIQEKLGKTRNELAIIVSGL